MVEFFVAICDLIVGCVVIAAVASAVITCTAAYLVITRCFR